jgi:hypothetical protein
MILGPMMETSFCQSMVLSNEVDDLGMDTNE